MVSNRGSIRWWQVWRYRELKRANEESLAALVRARPDFTEQDARYFMALCRTGQKTPPWLVDKMMGAPRDSGKRGL